ncbi:hypothetical protein MOQ_005220 [Trypanosoma cruzi marinkellei]|uniref:Uncharacterized protein n=1 Tax=Trypanosoma cruzi marinkellei TaxID=85056 RepID=K2MV25_TRYCR|nr:hypothetical protein MOQ_005220 [Trypanosoma cruzi marinkellei]
MFEILVEIAFSIFLCAIMAYYFFLSAPVEERTVGEGDGSCVVGTGTGRHANGAGGYTLRSSPPLERSRRCEGAMWCNVLGRWAALLVLGGGSIDKDVWTDRIAYFIEKGAKRLDGVIKQRRTRRSEGAGEERGERTLRVSPDTVRLVCLELGGGGPLNGGWSQQHKQQQQQQQAQQQQQQQMQQQQQQQPQQQQSYVSTQPVSGLFHARTVSDGNRAGVVYSESQEGGGAASPPIGAVLPRIGSAGIVSLEAPYSVSMHEITTEGGSTAATTPAAAPAVTLTMGVQHTLRCFSVPIIYEDHHFSLLLMCNVPLLFALPMELRIPADVLTLRCALSVRRVIFDGLLYAAFCGNLVELSFASEPQFTASFDVYSEKSCHRQQLQLHRPYFSQASSCGSVRGAAAGERTASVPTLPPSLAGNTFSGGNRFKEKLQEIVDLAVKRSLQSITYPCVLRGVVGPSRRPTSQDGTTGDDTSANSNDDGLLTWSLAKATLPLCC